jgi:hypothetical protein
LLAAGCGKSDGGAVSRADFAPQAAKIFCDSFAQCCSAQGQSVNAQSCTSTLSNMFEQSWAELGNRVGYDADAAGVCLSALRASVRCGSSEDEAIDDACRNVFIGTVPVGQACQSSQECAQPASGRAYCDPNGSNAVQQSICTLETEAKHAALGEACFSTCDGSSCSAVASPAPGGGAAPVDKFCYRKDGLYCGPSAVCAPLKQVGSSCDSYDACVIGSICTTDTKVCSAPRPNGSACERDSECASGDCADGTICQPLVPPADLCASGIPFKNND